MTLLLEVMARLRTPDTGCPWDLEQSFETIAPYTIEEAYEVYDAIERGDRAALKEELGDLLFQVVFHARLAEEEKAFDFDAVVEALVDKMLRRHPHVFGDGADRDARGQEQAWEMQKAAERAAKAGDSASVLDDVPLALPALLRALKLQKRAARVGFDWPQARQVLDKLNEEMLELAEEVAAETVDQVKVEEELGDMLFVYANLARKLEVDPEAALRAANAKFERRFKWLEAELKRRGSSCEASTLTEMDALWDEAKRRERQ